MSPTDADFPPDLRVLERQYELIREIGQGGMAAVFLARRRDSGQLVAIKAIRGRYLDDPDDVARQGLENLANGPTWAMGSADGGGPSPVGGLSRRDAVLLYSAGTEAMFGSPT